MYIMTADNTRLIDFDRLSTISAKKFDADRAILVGNGYSDDPEIIIGVYDCMDDACGTIQEIFDALAKDHRTVKLTRKGLDYVERGKGRT